jgi:hypothetical protein
MASECFIATEQMNQEGKKAEKIIMTMRVFENMEAKPNE